MTSRARRLLAAAASTVLIGLAAAACSAGDDDFTSDSSGDSSRSEPVPAQAADGAAAAPADDDAAYDAAGETGGDVAQTGSASASGGGSGKKDVVVDPDPRSLIKQGNVALQSTDVGRTLFDIRKVLQETGGEVSDEDTQADEQGDAELSLLTVRVPVDRYDAALQQLKGLGTGQEGVKLITSTSATKDVSTQVVDTDVRVELQKRSIQRISLLLDRATSLRDVVSIERELAGREADLGSLEKRQKFLSDQTTLSTITVSVERPAQKKQAVEKAEEKDESGFAAGFDNGWAAFQDVTTGLLTAVGALLPFALLALVLGVPVWLWLRRRQSRPVVGTPDAPTPAGA